MKENKEPRRALRIKKPPVLFQETQRIIRKVEEELKAPFLSYWNSPSGSVCQNDVLAFHEIFLKLGKNQRMYFFIKSDGGSGRASLRIVHLLRHFTSQFIALVPLNCSSAATMLALGANEIHMGPLAYLSAVDTSLTHDLSPIDKDNDRVSVSQDELYRIVKAWKRAAGSKSANPYQSLFQYIHPLVIGAVDRASSLSIRLCNEILSYHCAEDRKAKKISQILNSDYPSHSYPITIREAERIGLKVHPLNERVNELLIGLNELYSEMGQLAVTDFDEKNHHDNEILNILEGRDIQIYFQTDKDWHYRAEERRWVSLNDKSIWRKIERIKGRVRRGLFHIR